MSDDAKLFAKHAAYKAELAERSLWYSKHKSQISKESIKRIAYAQNNFFIECMERDYYNVYKSDIRL
ncbi:MAG: hypothetical protein ACI93N_001965 [Flavobacteriaceae bacterium]|jgi:hypothetical protein